jgi:hypothetical protein
MGWNSKDKDVDHVDRYLAYYLFTRQIMEWTEKLVMHLMMMDLLQLHHL